MGELMREQAALRVALDLLHLPTQIRHAREAPLPDGITELLRIATGDMQAIRNATTATGRQQDDVTQAAAFFIEQVLLAHDADSYRALGLNPDADSSELRRNMTLIMKYLHPDLDKNADRSMFITRVTSAWNDLKTPQKRAEYDRRLQARPSRRKTPKERSRHGNRFAPHYAKRQNGHLQTGHSRPGHSRPGHSRPGLWQRFLRLLQKNTRA